MTIVQHLQKNVEYVWMCLLNLVKENNRVRLAAYSLSQLTTLIIAYISRRRTDESSYTELLLILAHINSGHHRLVIEEIISQCLCQLSLTSTRCT